jgi:DNA-binding CsgD family transcriptional regulator
VGLGINRVSKSVASACPRFGSGAMRSGVVVTLVGRAAEVSRVQGLVRGLPDRGGALVLVGDPGIGKTALTEAAVAVAAARDVPVVTALGSEFESHLPYAALQQLFWPYRHRLAVLRPRQRAALEAAFGMGTAEPPDVYLVALATMELLSEIGGERALLVVVDDAHWMDGSTARVLAFAARRLEADPVAMLISLRTGYRSPLTDSALPQLEVLALADAAAGALLATARPLLDETDRSSILEIAQGNPLAVLELPPDLDGVGVGPQQRLSDRLQRAFAAQFAGLDDQARTVLLVAALHDNGQVSEIVEAANRLTSDPVSFATVERVAATGVVSVSGSVLGFRHPLVRSAVVGAASPEDARAVHAALATVVPVTSDRAAWHLAASVIGPDEGAATALEAVANRSLAQGNAAVLLRALEAAARLSATEDERSRRLVLAAEAAIEVGRLDRAETLAARVDHGALTRHDTARLALLQNSLDPQAHSATWMEQLAGHASVAADAGDVDLAVALILAAGGQLNRASFAFSRTRALQVAKQVVGLLDDGDVRALAMLAALDPLPHAQQVADFVARLDPTRLGAHADLLVGAAFVVDADPDLAALQRTLIDTYRRQGRLRSIARLQAIHSWTEITLANWPEAIQAADEGVRLARDIGDRQRVSGAIVGQAMIAGLRGEPEAAELLQEAERVAVSGGAQDVLTGIQLTRGVQEIAQGRYDAAVSALQRTFDPSDPSYHPLQSAWSLGDLAEAGYHAGRLDTVRAIIADLSTEKFSTPWRRMAESYAAPFLATDDEEIERCFHAGLEGTVRRWPTYRARMLLLHGQWLRRQGRVVEARDQLRAARELADALSMRPWAERARRELRAAGESSDIYRPKAWALLSPQELHVAQLAGQGLSNREIAERLFLSHRTVGSHLYRIFPKLGVTHRAQLAAVLAAPGYAGQATNA